MLILQLTLISKCCSTIPKLWTCSIADGAATGNTPQTPDNLVAVLSESDGITDGSVLSIKCHKFSMMTLDMASTAAINRLLLHSLIWFIAIQHSICKQLWSLWLYRAVY